MVQKKDAHPTVKDDSTLEKTQEQVREDLAKHSKFEQQTGVSKEELRDKAEPSVVAAEPKETFGQRTAGAEAPWAEYQRGVEDVQAEALKERQAQAEKDAKAAAKADKK